MSASIVFALRLIAAAALYAFLGWALYILWRDIQKQGRSLANRRVPGISLYIQVGGAFVSQKYFFQPAVIIGRDPGCDLFLDDEAVSTRHAQLIYHHNQWWLEDLSSTNGTMLNQTMVNMPIVVTSGDAIQCGSTSLLVTLSPDAVVPLTQPLEHQE